jgi:soluble lytic murein transglycosylase-like protein
MRHLALSILFINAVFDAPAPAGEVAVLSSGFRLRADRHEFAGKVVRLYRDGGFTEIDAALIEGFEQEVPPPAPPAAPSPALPAASSPHRDTATSARGGSLREMIDSVAKKYDLPPEFVHSVVAAESAYQANAVSPKGAVGLMQLMPATAKAYGADPADPAQNLEAGARHLRDLLLQYNGDSARALAAYNAGSGAVNKYNGVPPYNETQNYVYRVISKYRKAVSSSGSSN